MRRKLFSIISWFSAVLFVASAAMWIRSYVRDDMISVEKKYQHFIASRQGWLAVGDGEEQSWLFPDDPVRHFPFSDHWTVHWRNDAPPLNYPYDVKHIGFNYWLDLVDNSIDSHKGREFIVSYWMLCAAFGMAPLGATIVGVIRRRRYPSGYCQKCGYDLRASPARCPECGLVPCA